MIVAFVVTETGEPVAVNGTVVAPPAARTETGTVAAALSEVKTTSIPGDGAGPVRVTVPVDFMAPSIVLGDRVTDLTPGG